MAHKYGDRVRESTTTTGTGTITLGGAATGGYQAFSAVCANNDTVFYSISDPAGTKWEVGLGTWLTGGSISRTAGGVFSGSSGAGALVSFDAGTKDVMLVVPTRAGILGAGGGATVASAAALPVPIGRVCHVSGTTTITSILATNVEVGTVVMLVFDGILTVTDGSNLKLDGNYVTAADATLTLAFDGSNWYEITRSGALNTIYSPTSLTTVAGTLAVGTVADVAARGGTVPQWDEVTGPPGWDVIFDFTTVPKVPDFVFVSAGYSGSNAHVPQVMVWNYTTAAWDVLTTIRNGSDGSGLVGYTFAVDANYWNAGAMRVRFYHAAAGTGSHDLFVDFVGAR